MFNAQLDEQIVPEDLGSRKTVELVQKRYGSFNLLELVEEGVKLILTSIDTPGYGDQLNRQDRQNRLIKL